MEVKVKFNDINVKEEKEKTLVKILMLKGEKGDKGDGDVNIIEKVQVNGSDLPVSDKTVNVQIPTDVSSFNNDSGYLIENDLQMVKTADVENSSQITDGTGYARLNKIYGDTVQNGTPTPNNPVDIEVVTGDINIIISDSDNTSSQQFTIPLGEIELCKIKTYKDEIYKDNGKWYKKANIGKVKFSDLVYEGIGGTFSNFSTNENIAFYYQQSDLKVTGNRDDIFCNLLKSYSTTLWNGVATGINNYTNDTKFLLSVPFSNVEQYAGVTLTASNYVNYGKNYISSLDGYIYYILNAPTINEITDSELIEQLDEIYNFILYINETNFTITGDDLIPTLDIIYAITDRDIYSKEEIDDLMLENLDLINKKIYYFDNVATMKANNLNDGDMVITKGYYTSNDGGSAKYKIRKITNDDVVDNGSIIPLNDNTLIAELIIDNEVNVDVFGCKGNGTDDDSSYIQNAIDFITNSNVTKTLKFSAKTYFINNTINLTQNIILKGSSKTMYHDNTATILKRNRNIKLLNLSGKSWDINTDDSRASDIIISDMTLYTNSNEYFNEPLIYTKRAIYNHFDNLIFRGNGKAVFMDLSTFDSRFNNCDFVGNCDIEIVDSYDTEYHSQMIHGVNQIYFYGCRFEGYSKGNVIKIGNYARELYFFGTKFEGTPSDTNPIITTTSNNADIYMYGIRVSMLSGSDSYFANLQELTRSLFEVSYVDNSTSHTNALIKINNTSAINILFKPSLDISNYSKDYYIDNTGTNNAFKITGSLVNLAYFTNAKKLYSNPELMNNSNVLFDNVYASNIVPNSVQIKLRKSTEQSPKIWKLQPGYYNFSDDITQLSLFDPNGDTCFVARNSGLLIPKRLNIPHLSEQPSSVSEGDILINKFTDTNTPNLTIGVSNTSKRFGWGTSAPATGYWLKGGIVFNTEPTAGGNIGWICTATGTPGTWKSFGQIES